MGLLDHASPSEKSTWDFRPTCERRILRGVDGAPAVAHTANVLAALSLAVTDRIATAVGDVLYLPASDTVALSALFHVVPAPSVEQLRRVLGLTHSGTVRLVDRLVAAGLVTRGPGPDQRTTTVTLTEAGTRAALEVSRTREAAVGLALAALGDRERLDLDRLAGRLLVAMMRGPGTTRWICRMCDTAACGRYDDRCPIGREVAARTESTREEIP